MVIFEAVRLGDLNKVKEAIKLEGNVNAFDDFGNTLLNEAVQGKSYEIIKEILDSGASIKEVDDYEQSALHIAVKVKASPQIVKLLIDYNADVNAVDNYNGTPLHFAAEYDGDLDVTKMLIEKGANVLAENNDKETPYKIAVDKNNNIQEFLKHYTDEALLKEIISESSQDSEQFKALVSVLQNYYDTPINQQEEAIGKNDKLKQLSSPINHNKKSPNQNRKPKPQAAIKSTQQKTIP